MVTKIGPGVVCEATSARLTLTLVLHACVAIGTPPRPRTSNTSAGGSGTAETKETPPRPWMVPLFSRSSADRHRLLRCIVPPEPTAQPLEVSMKSTPAASSWPRTLRRPACAAVTRMEDGPGFPHGPTVRRAGEVGTEQTQAGCCVLELRHPVSPAIAGVVDVKISRDPHVTRVGEADGREQASVIVELL